MNQFLQDVLQGLSAPAKYLQSKYFYDAVGDRLFQQIMQCEDYYLTRCEMEIFTSQKDGIAASITRNLPEFDVIELGAGDASKSIHLLRELHQSNPAFTYYPVDISTNVIQTLEEKLPAAIEGLTVKGLNGEYFPMLAKAKSLSNKQRVVLFLGSNIGNIPATEALQFFQQFRSHLHVGDMVLIGFDLQKDPATILAAYNDKEGFTRQFNLNLLTRINNELSGNFEPSAFSHYPIYDPGTGACKSYLISRSDQQVEVADHTFHFAKDEPIFMEVSHKYTVKQVNGFAEGAGFKPIHNFFDSKHWFVDAVWQCL